MKILIIGIIANLFGIIFGFAVALLAIIGLFYKGTIYKNSKDGTAFIENFNYQMFDRDYILLKVKESCYERTDEEQNK